jgi:hypothetical protein
MPSGNQLRAVELTYISVFHFCAGPHEVDLRECAA